MTFYLKGARLERFVEFCRRVAKIQQTPDLISFVACEIEHIGFCRIITDIDNKLQKRFAAVCQANQMDPNDIRRRMRVVASVLKINKQVDYYDILGVSPDADGYAIKQAYRKKVQILHPDKTAGNDKNSEEFIKLHDAYVYLRDPKVRQICDQLHDCSGYWVEGKKSSQMPRWGVGFGRFLNWMFVLIGSVIIVTYAFDIYKNRSITLFLAQLIPRRLNEPEFISKNQFDKGSRVRAMKIENSKSEVPFLNNDAALETKSETVVAPRSMTKVDSEKKMRSLLPLSTKQKVQFFHNGIRQRAVER